MEYIDLFRERERPFAALSAFLPLLSDRSDEASNRTFTPICDVEETDEGYRLSFDMPGLDAEAIDIELQGGVLTVAGERRKRQARFQRSITLPENVRADQVDARYENGVLIVNIPKAAASRPTKIKVAGARASTATDAQMSTNPK